MALLFGSSQSLLYPRESPTRDVRRLDGIWKFKLSPIDDPDRGFVDGWFKWDWDRVKTIDNGCRILFFTLVNLNYSPGLI